MKPLKICLIAPLPPPYGGISHWTSMIINYAKKTSSMKMDVINTAPTWRSIHSKGFLLRTIGGSVQFFRDALKIVLSGKRKNFDVIHLTTSGQLAILRDLFVIYYFRLIKIPIVYHIRFGRVPEIAFLNTIEWYALTKCLRAASAVLAIDRATYKTIRDRVKNVNLQLIPNCIDFDYTEKYLNDQSRGKFALYVGWVIPSKGIEDLVAAWQNDSPSGWTLKVVGPYIEGYPNMLAKKYSAGSIEFFGHLPHEQIMELVSRCGVFVFPSHSEGFPNAVLEAMALKSPIVATRVGAIPEMLEEGCGVLVNAHDIKGITEALKLVCENDLLKVSMGELAFSRAQEYYSLKAIFEQYSILWHKLSDLEK